VPNGCRVTLEISAKPESVSMRRPSRIVERSAVHTPLGELEATLCHGSKSAAGFGHGYAKDDTSPEDSCRQRTLWAAQANPGTSVWHHQIGGGLWPVSVARTRGRQGRMESGDHELDHQADVLLTALLNGHHGSSSQYCDGYQHEFTRVTGLCPFSPKAQFGRLLGN
jgi:hypothetical protein